MICKRGDSVNNGMLGGCRGNNRSICSKVSFYDQPYFCVVLNNRSTSLLCWTCEQGCCSDGTFGKRLRPQSIVSRVEVWAAVMDGWQKSMVALGVVGGSPWLGVPLCHYSQHCQCGAHHQHNLGSYLTTLNVPAPFGFNVYSLLGNSVSFFRVAVFGQLNMGSCP